MTQMCVDTTTRQAAHLGFQVTVLADACAAKAVTGPDGVAITADQVHRTHLGSLSGFLADIKTVDDVAGVDEEEPAAPSKTEERHGYAGARRTGGGLGAMSGPPSDQGDRPWATRRCSWSGRGHSRPSR